MRPGEGLTGEGERVSRGQEGARPGQRGRGQRGDLGLDPELALVLVDGGVEHLVLGGQVGQALLHPLDC